MVVKNGFKKEKMKIVCISDCHGNFNFEVPECDLLLIAGDVCPAYHDPLPSLELQKNWLKNEFNGWLGFQPAKHKVMIAGNHDWLFQISPEEVPELNCHYLEDSSIEIEELKIWGSPWQLEFNNWAFNLTEKELKKKWNLIPDDIDILLVHSPPYGILDELFEPGNKFIENIGSPSLRKKIFEIIPKLVVFGHIHERGGYTEYVESPWPVKFVNACLLNDDYKICREPFLINL